MQIKQSLSIHTYRILPEHHKSASSQIHYTWLLHYNLPPTDFACQIQSSPDGILFPVSQGTCCWKGTLPAYKEVFAPETRCFWKNKGVGRGEWFTFAVDGTGVGAIRLWLEGLTEVEPEGCCFGVLHATDLLNDIPRLPCIANTHQTRARWCWALPNFHTSWQRRNWSGGKIVISGADCSKGGADMGSLRSLCRERRLKICRVAGS